MLPRAAVRQHLLETVLLRRLGRDGARSGLRPARHDRARPRPWFGTTGASPIAGGRRRNGRRLASLGRTTSSWPRGLTAHFQPSAVRFSQIFLHRAYDMTMRVSRDVGLPRIVRCEATESFGNVRINHVSVNARDLRSVASTSTCSREPIPTRTSGSVQRLARRTSCICSNGVDSTSHHHLRGDRRDISPLYREAAARRIPTTTVRQHLVELPAMSSSSTPRSGGNLVEIDRRGSIACPATCAPLRGLWDFNPQTEKHARAAVRARMRPGRTHRPRRPPIATSRPTRRRRRMPLLNAHARDMAQRYPGGRGRASASQGQGCGWPGRGRLGGRLCALRVLAPHPVRGQAPLRRPDARTAACGALRTRGGEAARRRAIIPRPGSASRSDRPHTALAATVTGRLPAADADAHHSVPRTRRRP